MKLHLTAGIPENLITGYETNEVLINGIAHPLAVLVTPSQVLTDDLPESVEGLSETVFERIGGLQPEVVLLGTGSKLHFPHPRLYAPLTAQRVGIEAMDTGAACRTYNILVAEGRQVVALLLRDRAAPAD